MLLLSDRKEFLLRPDDFTPFVFNDVSLTNLPARVSEDQNSVRHKPTYKRQKIKLKVNLINTSTTTKLQGNTGAITFAMDCLDLLHHYKPFEHKENVGVFFDNKDKTEAITLEAHGYTSSLIKEQRCAGRLFIHPKVPVLFYHPTIICRTKIMKYLNFNNLGIRNNLVQFLLVITITT